jgi:hypothetical protein
MGAEIMVITTVTKAAATMATNVFNTTVPVEALPERFLSEAVTPGKALIRLCDWGHRGARTLIAAAGEKVQGTMVSLAGHPGPG